MGYALTYRVDTEHMPTVDVIAAADIGSVEQNRFGWAIKDVENGATSTGKCITDFVNALVNLSKDHKAIALGFECPLFVPVREDPVELTKAREGEGNRPWSAGAGATVLATGLAEIAWILRQLRSGVKPEPRLTFQWNDFVTSGGLFLWEAFVSGAAKSHSHAGDAELAVRAFGDSLPHPQRSNFIREPTVVSLVGAAALWSGWAVDISVLRESCLVISAATIS